MGFDCPNEVRAGQDSAVEPNLLVEPYLMAINADAAGEHRKLVNRRGA